MADKDKRKKIITSVNDRAAHAEVFPVDGSESDVPEQFVRMIPYRRIVELPGMNPRTEGWADEEDVAFAEQGIKAAYEAGKGYAGSGFLQPLGGRWLPQDIDKLGNPKPDARVVLVWGGRRKWTVEWNIKHHGWTAEHLLPVFIQTASNEEAFNLAFAENFYQKRQTPWDVANALHRILDQDRKTIDGRLGSEHLARKFKKSHEWVRKHLALVRAKDIPELMELYDGTERTLTPIRWLIPVPPPHRKRIARLYQNGKIDQKGILEEKRKLGIDADDDEPPATGNNGHRRRYGGAKANGVAFAPAVDIESYLNGVASSLGHVQDAIASMQTQGAKPPMHIIRKWRKQVRDVTAAAQKIDESL